MVTSQSDSAFNARASMPSSSHLKTFHKARQNWYKLLNGLTVIHSEDPRASLARLSWIEEGHVVSRYLTKTVAAQLLDSWGHFKEHWRSSYPGNLVAIPLYRHHCLAESSLNWGAQTSLSNGDESPIAFAKAYPTWPRLFSQGMVCMWLLTGYGPLGSLCRLDYPGCRGYPVLLTAYAGETVLSADTQMNKPSEDHPMSIDYEARLHPYYFTLKVLETMLLNHHTDEPNNVSFQPVFDDKLSAIGSQGKPQPLFYRLLSFDSEKKFVNPILKWRHQRIQLKVVTVTYLMSQMALAPDREALKAFVNRDAYALMQEWLSELDSHYTDPFPCERNTAGPYLFSEKEVYYLFRRKPSRSYLPNLFYPGMLEEFYCAMRQLQLTVQEALQTDRPFKDHFALLKAHQPRIATIYKRAFLKGSNSVARHQLFQTMETHYSPTLKNDKTPTVEEYERYAFGAHPIVSARSKDSIRRAVRFGHHGIAAGREEIAWMHHRWESIEAALGLLQGTRRLELQNPESFSHLIDVIVQAHEKASGMVTPIQRFFQYLGFTSRLSQSEDPLLRSIPEEAIVLLDDVLRMQVLNLIDYAHLKETATFSSKSRWVQLQRLLGLGRYKHLKIKNNVYLDRDALFSIIKASPLLVTLDLTGCTQLSSEEVGALTQVYSPFLSHHSNDWASACSDTQ